MVQDTAGVVQHVEFVAGPAIPDVALVCAALSVGFCAVQVAVVQRSGKATAWIVCGLSAVAVAGLWVGTIIMTWPDLLHSFGALWTIVAVSGAPFALATLVIARSVTLHASRGPVKHFALGWLGFVAGLTGGLVLGVLPELIRAFA